MNLFWKKLFGGIASTAKFEQEMKLLREDMQRYVKVEQSVELAEYNELAHVIGAAEFKEKKKMLENRKYKDTEEYRDSRKFQALQNRTDIKTYYKVHASEDLKEYLAFLETPEAKLLSDKKEVTKSEKLMKFKRFENAKSYKTFTRLHNSYLIKEYEELKKKVSTPEFVKMNEFWANKNRWQLVAEYQKEKRFNELAQNPDIQFFMKEKPERFNAYRSLSVSFSDEFDWNVLSKSNWNFGFYYKDKSLIGDHSFANEQQANNAGKNISVSNGVLQIATRKEHTKARAWDAVKGFVEKEFEYSSDVMQSADKIGQQYGIFQAKLRCSGKINHAFWLGSGQKQPLVEIFHYNGKSIKVGTFDKNGKSEEMITGLNPSDFYVYTLIWSEKEMVWMINNLVVYRTTNHIPKEEMYPAFNSFISQSQDASEGLLEVDWVRVYS